MPGAVVSLIVGFIRSLTRERLCRNLLDSYRIATRNSYDDACTKAERFT
jgi:hypothetical protein